MSPIAAPSLSPEPEAKGATWMRCETCQVAIQRSTGNPRNQTQLIVDRSLQARCRSSQKPAGFVVERSLHTSRSWEDTTAIMGRRKILRLYAMDKSLHARRAMQTNGVRVRASMAHRAPRCRSAFSALAVVWYTL
jgi:hypothetical protein